MYLCLCESRKKYPRSENVNLLFRSCVTAYTITVFIRLCLHSIFAYCELSHVRVIQAIADKLMKALRQIDNAMRTM